MIICVEWQYLIMTSVTSDQTQLYERVLKSEESVINSFNSRVSLVVGCHSSLESWHLTLTKPICLMDSNILYTNWRLTAFTAQCYSPSKIWSDKKLPPNVWTWSRMEGATRVGLWSLSEDEFIYSEPHCSWSVYKCTENDNNGCNKYSDLSSSSTWAPGVVWFSLVIKHV